MLNIYKTVNNELTGTEILDEGVWINLINPNEEELNRIKNAYTIEPDYLRAALDEEERARIESESNQILIVIDTPMIEKDSNMGIYTTIPLAIILAEHVIITVCLKDDTLLNDFINKKVKMFLTQYKTRFVLQILYKNSARYLQYLKYIDKTSNRIEQDLHKSMKNKELIQMLKLEKSLVFFSTALKSNEAVLERLMRNEYLKNYPEDRELLEDVIIENKQAIEMANIYSSILSGTMDAFASIISNNVNIVMKFLASVTIVMAIPTMISSFYGMNVLIPNLGPGAFWIIIGISLALSFTAAFILFKKKMF